ncbi:MAG: type II secretion system F family protein [Gammaproteobacteria bacterium]|nr:type II secretion system F family protein [Gammaproteobacteria bacterium]NNC56586.1 type II secretion system F family protein [Woeseiaceae bacterium]NNL49350.1 type II secretion system F family protein [Woeseiaceae bacterium]
MSNGMMIFIVMIFVTVFLLVQGLATPVFGESAKARKRLKNKLADIESANEEEAFSSILRQKYLRELAPWERQLERLPRMEALAAFIEQSGLKYLSYRVVMLSIILAIVAAFGAWIVMRVWYAPIVAAVIAAYLPFMKISSARAKRIATFEEQLPDAIDTMGRALRAGHPFPATLKMIGEEFEDPIASEFDLTFGDINYGNDVRRAMLGLLSRIPTVTVMALVTAVLVQKESGGNLAEILERISAVIRGRFKLNRKVKTLSAEGRMSAWVLAMVPFVLFVVLMITTPDYLPTLIDDARGQKMIVGSMISASIGILWIRKILRIEV